MPFTALRRNARVHHTPSADGSPGADEPGVVATTDGLIGREVDGGCYVDVDGTPIWHYVAGEQTGSATVLLHGAFGSAANWGAQIPDFIESGLRVYVPERSGRGHSPDIDAAFTHQAAATQMIRYLETVVDTPAHLVGWSDGAAIVTMIAAARPDLVQRTVVVGQYFHNSGDFDDDFFRLLSDRDPATIEALRDDYVRFTPDPDDHFGAILEKTEALVVEDPRLGDADLAAIPAPTLVVQGDRDVVRVADCVELVGLLPHGRLAVLPGTHILPVESPDLFNPLVVSFLAADPPSNWRP